MPTNIRNPDKFYEVLTDAQRDMSEQEASDMNAGLDLIFANQVGILTYLQEAISLAAGSKS
ncbi:MAG: DUF2783 domain-containing protein [Pseudooceanicola sp.]|uniref:DUF2783 domain-containing protein n=1 Tax=Sulfitobacter sp. EhC04 TaxID=1849168 RepID=UPI0009ED4D80|nr:DUF2783 domain-containing protein [Sulfitobacter sp. EhC04]MAY86059.1 DUF2783 domain-containing protein [Pseudooceanicola sp.]